MMRRALAAAFIVLYMLDHPSSIAFSLTGSKGGVGWGGVGGGWGWSVSQLPSGERQGAPRTSYQLITGPTVQRQTMFRSSYLHLRVPLYLNECLWFVGGSQSTWREATKMCGEHANSIQKSPWHPQGIPTC